MSVGWRWKINTKRRWQPGETKDTPTPGIPTGRQVMLRWLDSASNMAYDWFSSRKLWLSCEPMSWKEGAVQIKRQISFNNNKSYKSFAWSAEDKAKSFQKDNDDMLQRGDNNNLLQTHTHTHASWGKCRETRLQQQMARTKRKKRA